MAVVLATRDGESECLAEDELVRFVDGGVIGHRATKIRAHVDACDDCRELLAIAGREAALVAAPAGDSRGDGFAPGDELGRLFRIEGQIGRGGMGIVYAAVGIATSRRVALKVLNEQTAVNAASVLRFVREGRLAARLVSPHAARVFDVGRLDSGARYIVMELLEGEDLERFLLRTGPLPCSRALEHIAQACHALAEAHASGIVHRDIKLPNLFLAGNTPSGAIVKVLDFGLAKDGALTAADGSLTRLDTVLGTLHYMSPEQMLSARDVDARTDIWALGVCLYRLLTARFPFHSENPVRLTALILGASPPPIEALRPDVPREVAAIIMRCLARNPRDRIGSAQELAATLASLAGGPGAVAAAGLQERRGRRTLELGVLAVSTLVASVAVAALLARNAPSHVTPSTASEAPPSAATSAVVESSAVPSAESSSAPAPGSSAQGPPEHRSRASGSARPKSTPVRSPLPHPSTAATEKLYEKM